MWWRPCKDDVREYIDCFPYIDADNRLRIWDLDRSQNVRTKVNMASLSASSVSSENGGSGKSKQRGRVVIDSFSAEDTKKRFHRLFGIIQRKGYWEGL